MFFISYLTVLKDDFFPPQKSLEKGFCRNHTPDNILKQFIRMTEQMLDTNQFNVY